MVGDGSYGDQYDAIPASELFREGDGTVGWVVEGLIPRGSIALISAPPGRGKSWLALDLAYAATIGGSWMGWFPVSKSRMLLVENESQEPALGERFKKLAKGRRCHIPADVLVMGREVDLDDDLAFQTLRGKITDQGPQLVIIDPLIPAGRCDENQDAAPGRIFRRIGELVIEFGVTLVLVADRRGWRRERGDGSSTPGPSADELAFVDVAFTIEQLNGHLVLNHLKRRWNWAMEPLAFVIEDTADDGVVVRGVADLSQAEEETRLEAHGKTTKAVSGEAMARDASDLSRDKKQAGLDDAKKTILTILGREWMKRQEIKREAKACGISEKKMDAALKALVEDEGRAEVRTCHEGRRRWLEYRLPQGPDSRSSDREHAEERKLDVPIEEQTHKHEAEQQSPSETSTSACSQEQAGQGVGDPPNQKLRVSARAELQQTKQEILATLARHGRMTQIDLCAALAARGFGEDKVDKAAYTLFNQGKIDWCDYIQGHEEWREFWLNQTGRKPYHLWRVQMRVRRCNCGDVWRALLDALPEGEWMPEADVIKAMKARGFTKQKIDAGLKSLVTAAQGEIRECWNWKSRWFEYRPCAGAADESSDRQHVVEHESDKPPDRSGAIRSNGQGKETEPDISPQDSEGLPPVSDRKWQQIDCRNQESRAARVQQLPTMARKILRLEIWDLRDSCRDSNPRKTESEILCALGDDVDEAEVREAFELLVDEGLLRRRPACEAIGGEPEVTYCLAYAADNGSSEADLLWPVVGGWDWMLGDDWQEWLDDFKGRSPIA